MKRLSLVLIALLFTASFSFSQKSYTMFENTYLFVKSGMEEEFAKAMAEHNQKYHADGPYHTNMWMVTGGIYSGAVVNSMGPLTFTDLDSRPDSKEHNEDWMGNVMPYVEKVGETGYWKRSDKNSYQAADTMNSKILITIYDIEHWQTYRFKDVVKNVAEVYKSEESDHSFSLYFPAFDMAHGRDAATVWGFNEYSELIEKFINSCR